MTVCTNCFVDKIDSEFSINRSRPNGLATWCKVCYSVKKKQTRSMVSASDLDARATAYPGPFKCSVCFVEKARDEFYLSKEKRNGLMSRCKDCQNASSVARAKRNPEKAAKANERWRLNNPDTVRKLKEDWVAANPERVREHGRTNYARHRESRIASAKQYFQEKPEVNARATKRYAERNPEKTREKSARWRKANPERARRQSSSWRVARLRAVPPWMTYEEAKERELQWRLADGHAGMELDHIVPLTPPLAKTLGGKPTRSRTFVGPLIPIVYGWHYEANWQPLKRKENITKGNRDWPDSPWS
jgi:hypothetical protein